MASSLRSVALVGLLATASAQRPGARTVRRFLAAGEDEPLMLAQTSVARLQSASGAQSSGREPLKADWFGSFALGESSYDAAADRSAMRSDGWDLKKDDPYKEGNVKEAVYFHESPSAGSKEAWQTHFPALSGGPAGRVKSIGAWHVDQGGHWVQDYQVPDTVRAGSNIPGWFDASIAQYDGFGREKSPVPGSPRFYAEGYQERAVNTTIQCREAGCIASTYLQAFNGNTETATHCKLSLFLHPTDFDDQYSGERLTFIKVNGITVNTDCFPMVSGCNASAQAPMFSCLQELPIDHLIDSTGFLNISAQISDVVDECPYQGNLLSGVPLVTCLVAEKPTPPPGLSGILPPRPVISTPPPEATFFSLHVPLQCPFRGCVATANMGIGPTTASRISQCLLTVKFYQTDFDNQEDSNEMIEYIEVDGVHIAKNIMPGQNPCRSVWAGRALGLAEMEYAPVMAYDVTANATSGLVSLAAKISRNVDECAHNGFLLDGRAEMNCTLLTSKAAAQAANATSSGATSNASNATSLVQVAGPTAVSATDGSAERRAKVPSSLRELLLKRRRPEVRPDLRNALRDRLRRREG